MTETSDELENLIALADRLIPEAAPWWGQFGEASVIRPGRPSPQLQPDVPIPPDSRVIGSYTSGSFSMTLFETTQIAIHVAHFYAREMESSGWNQRDTSGGFLPPEQTEFWLQFCRSTQGPALYLRVAQREGGSLVSLQLETDPERGPCGRPQNGGRRGGRSSPLPVLAAPPGSTMGMHGRGPALGQYNSTAEMTSGLDLAGMVEYFSGALQESAWQVARSGRTGPVAWSTWSCRDESGEPVEGTFLVFEYGEHRYSLQVNRDIAPGSREEAERTDREDARAAARQMERRPARVEVDLQEDDAAAALQEMILRIAAPEASRLLIGCMPNDLQNWLALPPHTRLLGSLVTGRSASVYLGGDAQPHEFEAFYRTQFPPTGWTVRDESHRLNGFTARPSRAEIDYLFCPRGSGIAFRVSAYFRSEGTEAKIHVFGDEETSPCRDRRGRTEGGRWSRQSPLPLLPAPPDVDFCGGGDHSGEDSWGSNGYLFGTPDPGEVLGWYGQQFSANGWTETDRGQDEVVVWSRWRKGIESALFLAVHWPGTDVYR